MGNRYDADYSNSAQTKRSDSVRYCTKCGCPLVSDSSYNECDNCRREKSRTTGTVLAAAAGLLLTVVSAIFRSAGNNSGNDK